MSHCFKDVDLNITLCYHPRLNVIMPNKRVNTCFCLPSIVSQSYLPSIMLWCYCDLEGQCHDFM